MQEDGRLVASKPQTTFSRDYGDAAGSEDRGLVLLGAEKAEGEVQAQDEEVLIAAALRGL